MSKLIFAVLASCLALNVASANEVKYVVPTCDNVAEVHLDQDFNLLDLKGKPIRDSIIPGKAFYDNQKSNDNPDIAKICYLVKEGFKQSPNEKYAFDIFVRRNSIANNKDATEAKRLESEEAELQAERAKIQKSLNNLKVTHYSKNIAD